MPVVPLFHANAHSPAAWHDAHRFDLPLSPERQGAPLPGFVLCSLVMSSSTRATVALEASGVAFTVHAYQYDPDADRIGMQAAEALGESRGGCSRR